MSFDAIESAWTEGTETTTIPVQVTSKDPAEIMAQIMQRRRDWRQYIQGLS